MPPKKKPVTAEIYDLTDLEQVKVLADPLRVRILEAFCDGERTTKQVAEILDEKPTRLYHHVDALERVGLIRLVETRQNRGTVEKYFRSVAKLFRADPRLFQSDGGEEIGDSVTGVVTTMFETTARELKALLAAGNSVGSEEEALVSFCEIRASQDEIDAARKSLVAALNALSGSLGGDPPRKAARRYRLSLAFYPLDAEDAGRR